MNVMLKQKVDLMVENYKEFKTGFKWEANLVKHFGAMVHATNDKRVDIDRLKEIKKYIKEETSWTSYFRGTGEFLIVNLLAFEDDYKSFFENMINAYDKLKEAGFRRSPQLPLAAYTIVRQVPIGEWDYRIQRTKKFYDKMKENHYWLTSSDDYVFAAVLATTDLEIEATSRKIEECYSFLNKEGFYKGNDLQTLSHILAIGEEGVEDKCSKAVSLYRSLKEVNCKLQYTGLATLGLLALITNDINNTVSEIKEVFDYISDKDGYGFWSIDKNTKVILCATLVSDYYVDEIKKGVIQITLSNSINAIIIAQQQAAVAAACAASAAAASSASS
ncbi:hypothetical protein HMPREF1982_03155 [Clostridiales bacterium oral taxon 876 str. F0540]|nr:hypothetical protein HMPREF1982_03155 [Clostridiales bacterium oral taxon 876 str. F0540]